MRKILFFYLIASLIFAIGCRHTIAGGTSMVYPIFKAWDDNGDPLAGGTLETYYVGTSTPKATYSDYDCSTPNSTTITLDSNGEATIYTCSGAYKLVLKDSDGTTMWTHAYYKAPVDITNQYFLSDYNDLAAAATAVNALNAECTLVGDDDTLMNMDENVALDAEVTFKSVPNEPITTTGYTLTFGGPYIGAQDSFDGTGTINFDGPVTPAKNMVSSNATIDIDGNFQDCTFQVWPSGATVTWSTIPPPIRPDWWGATGDGSTNDYTAINAAITSFIAIGNYQKTFLFTRGKNYKTNTGLAFTLSSDDYNETIISGYGAQITSGVSSGRLLTVTSAATVRNIILEGIKFTGNQSEDGCILFDGGVSASGHYLYEWKIIDPICEGFTGDGIEITNHAFEGQIVRPIISAHSTNTTSYGIYLNDTASGNVALIDIYSPNTRYGLYGIYSYNASAVNIFGGECILAYEEGCYVTNMNGGSITGLHLENNWVSAGDIASGYAGLRITGAGTVSGITGTTSQYQRYTVDVNPTATGSMIINGVTGAGSVVNPIYVRGNAGSALTVIGNATLVSSSTNCTIHRIGAGASDATNTSTSGTGEDDLKSFTIPADTLGQTGGVVFHCAGTVNDNNNGNKTIKFYFGAGSTTVQSAADVTGDWELEVKFISKTNSAQKVIYRFWLDGALVAHGKDDDAEDQTSDITFKITGECSDAGDSITQDLLRVNYL